MIYHCTFYKQGVIRSETIDGDWRVLRAFLQRCKDDDASMVRVVRQSGDLAGITHKVYFKKKNEPLDYEAILAHLKTLSCEERYTDSQGNLWTCRDGYWNVVYALERHPSTHWSLTLPTRTESERGWFESEEREHFIRDAYRLSALNDPFMLGNDEQVFTIHLHE